MEKWIGKRELSMAMVLFLLMLSTMTAQCQTIKEGLPGSNATAPVRIFPETPITVTDDGLSAALQIYSPFVLDCWELGCSPCQSMDSKIDLMAAIYKGKIVFGKLCTDYNPITTRDYAVSRTPTLLIFNNSTLVYKQVGNYPYEDLEKIILTVLHMR